MTEVHRVCVWGGACIPHRERNPCLSELPLGRAVSWNRPSRASKPNKEAERRDMWRRQGSTGSEMSLSHPAQIINLAFQSDKCKFQQVFNEACYKYNTRQLLCIARGDPSRALSAGARCGETGQKADNCNPVCLGLRVTTGDFRAQGGGASGSWRSQKSLCRGAWSDFNTVDP